MKKKLAVIMCAVMLISTAIISIRAVGAETTVTVGECFNITGDDPTEGTDFGYGYTYDGGRTENNVLVIKSGKHMTISGATTDHRIVVDAEGVDVDLTFKNLNIDYGSIDGNTGAAFEIIKAKSVTITIAEGSKNRLVSGTGGAGLQNNSAAQKNIVPLKITGKGSLVAVGKGGGAGIGGGNNSCSGNIDINLDGGIIIAAGDKGGAGIGGGSNGGGDEGAAERSNGEGINITGGTVIASGGKIEFDDNGYVKLAKIDKWGEILSSGSIRFDAGGNIRYYDENNAIIDEDAIINYKIVVNGDAVNGSGGGGAGIGGGKGGSGSGITISNSTVYAYGSNTGTSSTSLDNDKGSAGIGGGAGGNGSDITISNSTVTAYGFSTNNIVSSNQKGTGGAGIGGGSGGNGSGITIENSTVDAYGQRGGAGIGGGANGSGSGITITGGDVRAITDLSISNMNTQIANSGGKGGAGIGGGVSGYGSGINISGGANVTAWGGGSGAGIGGGNNGNGGDIEIDNEGGTIEAIGPSAGAGIGGGGSGNGINIIISDGVIEKAQSSSGAGIGGGGGSYNNGGNGSNINIYGGDITAISSSGAGIGGGNNGNGGNAVEVTNDSVTTTYEGIKISGGDIKATSSSGAGIGGGYGGNGSNITIDSDDKNSSTNIKITAMSSSGGAGIGGGGNGGNGSNITIGSVDKSSSTNIDITATSSTGAGIGGGQTYSNGGNGENITINDGNINAKGGAGIGGSAYSGTGGNGKNITITGGNIEAKGIGGAGIGGRNVEGITISGGTVNAISEGGPPAAGIGGNYQSTSVTGIEISGGTVTATGSIYGGVGIGGGSTQTDITITAGTVTANGGGNAPGISGTDVYIGKDGTTTSTSYPWVYTNKINSTNDHSDSYHGIVFDENYNDNYGKLADGAEATEEEKKISEVRQEHQPDGVVYGDVSLVGLKEPYVLESGETLNVHEGGTLTTGNDEVGNKLTLKDGAALYLEDGAALNDYQHISGYQDEGNGSKILHECTADPAEPGDAETTCTICGSPVPHKWRTDWEKNATHHWHNCDADDCSVLAKAVECSITENSKKNGYGEHKFGDPDYDYSKLTFTCKDCGYTYSVEKDKISIKKVGKDGENDENDESKVPLAGAEFELYGTSTDEETGDEIQIKVGEATSTLNDGETEAVAVFTITKGINLGQTYYIKETAAPDDYAKSDTVYTVVLNAVESDEPDEIEVTAAYGILGSAEPPTDDIPECVNTKINIAPIQIKKVDDKEEALPGATFGLYSDADCKTQVGSDVKSVMDEDENNAIASFTAGIEIGETYYIKETKAPDDYKKSDAVFVAKVSEKGTVSYGELTFDNDGKLIFDDDGNAVYTSLDNIPECVNTKIVPGDIHIKKVDDKGEALPGATFGLYKEGETGAFTVKIGSGTSGEDGMVFFTLNEGEEIELKTDYMIMETAAPTGYKFSEREITVNVGADGKVKYDGSEIVPEYKNEKITIQIKKVDDKEEALPGATFGLYSDADCKTQVGSDVEAVMDEDKTTAIASFTTGIEIGETYYIKETKAPDDYKKSDAVFVAKVSEKGTVSYGELTFDNDGKPILDDDGNAVYKSLDNIPECVNTKINIDPIQIIKVDDKKAALPGATFGLYSDADCKTQVGSDVEAVMDEDDNAIASFTAGIELGETYYIKEITAPTGYTASEDVFTATVGESGKVSYGELTFDDEGNITFDDDGNAVYKPLENIPNCVNTKINIAPIQIKKVDDKKAALPGATFGLYSDADCKTQVGSDVEAVMDEDDTNAIASFTTGIELGKTYYIKEITAPTGYTASEKVFTAIVGESGKVSYGELTFDDEGNITFDDDGNAVYKPLENIPNCVNTKINIAPIQIKKVDDKGEALPGAIFGLYGDANCDEGTELVTATSSVAEGDTNAIASFTTGIKPGNTYYIKETKAPDDYKKSDAVFVAKVSEKGTVSYGELTFDNDGKPIFDDYGNAVYTSLDNIPECVNTKINIDPIQIIKVDDKEEALPGATFGLYSDADCKTQVGSDVEAVMDEDDNAIASFTTGIELGKTYYIKETTAPTGYTASEKVFTATVGESGKVSYGELIFDNDGKLIFDDDGNAVYKSLDNIPECVNTKINIDPIQIKKVDDKGEALPGAIFGLYSDANCNKGTELVTATSSVAEGDTNAIASFTTGIKPGNTYYIKETKAPDDYKKSDEVFVATVGEDGTVTYVTDNLCVNTKITIDPIQIIAIDGDTQKPLPGATFELSSIDRMTITGITELDSENNAIVSFTEGIEVGKSYLIRQIGAPDGYISSNKEYTASVDEDGNVTYDYDTVNPKAVPIYENYKIDPIRIIKVDGDGNALAGAIFGLYSDANCNKGTELVTAASSVADGGTDAIASFTTGIKPGKTYYIKEITAPDDYKKSDEVFVATVGENGTITYVTGNLCVNEKSTSPDEPVTPPDEPVTPPDEPVTPPDEPVTPPDEPVTPPDEPVTPPDEPVTPPDKPTTPDKPITPDKPTTPVVPTNPVIPTNPVVPVSPVVPFPPVVPSPVVTPAVTETTTSYTEEEIIYDDDPYVEDVSSAAGINDDGEYIDPLNSSKNCAAVIILIASFAVGFILHKKASK